MRMRIALSVLIVLSAMYSNALPPSEEGKAIFTARCQNCHNINKVFVGPALAGVDQRHSMDWIVKFVQSSNALIKSGDKEAGALFAQFKNMPMPDHPDLTADNIKNIVEYIKDNTLSATVDVKAPDVTKRSAYITISFSYGLYFIFLCILAMVVYTLHLALRVKEYRRTKIWG